MKTDGEEKKKKSLTLNQVEEKISRLSWGAVLLAVNLHSWMLPFPHGVMGKESVDRTACFHPHPSLLIQPKHLTKEVRWRSPGSVGDQSRFSENKRSLEDGKADVTRRGRLALKT